MRRKERISEPFSCDAKMTNPGVSARLAGVPAVGHELRMAGPWGEWNPDRRASDDGNHHVSRSRDRKAGDSLSFSGDSPGRVLRSGEHLVPEAALEALADQDIPFAVRGKATYEQQLAAFRGAAAPPIQ